MLCWCNEAFGANEAEDMLTTSNLINCPTLFEDTTHCSLLAVGTNSGLKLTGQ